MMPEQYQQYSPQSIRDLQQDSWNRYVLENKELLEELSHLLQGEILVPTIEKDEETSENVYVMKWTKSETQKPPMNEKGYYYTMRQLTSVLNKANSTGNVVVEKAMLLVNQCMKAITASYIINMKEFEIESTSDIRSIRTALTTLLVMHFSKSVNMKLIEKLTTTTNISEQKITADKMAQTTLTS